MAAETTLQISVVIPSHNRRDALARSLAAFNRQTLGPEAFEVIVCLDGCVDDSAAMLAVTHTPYALRWIAQPASGAGPARNAAARLARAPMLVFVDDDIEASPGFLAAHLAAHAKGRAEVVVGYCRPKPVRDGLFEQGLRNWWENLFDEMGRRDHIFSHQDLLSGNVSLGRERFERIGGFDETFACREDYEFGWRLIQNGARLAYAPKALGDHHDATDLAGNLRRMRKEGQADVQFGLRHPGALPHLPFVVPPWTRKRRLARKLAFRWTRAGDAIAALGQGWLGLLETVGMRQRWWNHSAWLRDYWYLRGVAEGLPTPGHYSELLAQRWAMEPARPPVEAPPPPRHWREVVYGVGELEVSTWTTAPALKDLTYPARLLVRNNRTAIGWLELVDPPAIGRSRLAQVKAEVSRQLEWNLVRNEIARDLFCSLPEPLLTPISVVICTRDRTDNLRRCLAAVTGLDYPAFEVIVVDNAPATTDTFELVKTLPTVRYVREDRPGLDWARNRGIAEARHAIVAFTDDDTRVDDQWLKGMARAFAQDEVMAVTGQVTPMKLDTPARVYFEDIYGGMGKGLTPRWFRSAKAQPGDLLWASACGVGANMALRKALIPLIGAFDPGLDVGTQTRGGGDIEFFHRVMAGGHTLVYEPGAIVWHEHRGDFDALRRQLADNGAGFVAYLMTCARNKTVPLGAIWKFALVDWGLHWLVARLIRPKNHLRQLVWDEIGGALKGFGGYRRARKALAQSNAPATPDYPASHPSGTARLIEAGS